jgi:cellulose synthase/poly-beta-1,6-N-acetylglucosamine synthase-like glycosyltransferase
MIEKKDISVVILCRNESYELAKCITNNSLLKFLDNENIVVIDSSEGENLNIEKKICKDLNVKFIEKKIGNDNINGISDLRNFGSYNCPTDFVLHIDVDELFSTKLFEDIGKYISTEDSKEKAWAYRFPRINIPFYEQYPDYQTRLINKEKCIWEGDIHELVKVLEDPLDHHILKEYPIIHKDVGHKIKLDRNIRWSNAKKNILVCSLFRDSEKYLYRFLNSLDYNIDYIYHNKESAGNILCTRSIGVAGDNGNKIELELCFIEGSSKDNTWDILKKFCKNIKEKYDIKYTLEKNDINQSLDRFDKLAILRNMLIKLGLKNKHDYVLFIDSDIIFDKDLIIKLVNSIEKNKADVIAPLITIEKFRTFDNDYFYDQLAYIDKNGKNFTHHFPYISVGDIEIKKMICKEPIDMQSVGTCYLAKSELFNLNDFQNFNVTKCYREIKNKNICTYSGNGKSEQVRFFENLKENNKESKIILDPGIQVLHINLENIGLKWH